MICIASHSCFFVNMGKKKSFIDRIEIIAISGNGGNGCVSFRREKSIPHGGPDGGDGGTGGDVILEADKNLFTLLDFFYNPQLKAKNGSTGMGKCMSGVSGKTCLSKVPVGTLVRDFESGIVLCDLVQHGQKFIAAKGGVSGRGNTRFKAATRQTPRYAEEGKPGETLKLLLELKLIADAGLVGFPNAGKSTLISSVSSARPRIAAYPFTTLVPNLGVVNTAHDTTFTLADIPGLIKGACENQGLGHDFLRHIERTRGLLYVIDISGSEGRNPADDFKVLKGELQKHDKHLLSKPYLIALNKVDLIKGEKKIKDFILGTGEKKEIIVPISAKEKINLQKLIEELLKLIENVKKYG